LNKGQVPTAIHFAQVKEMDGLFLTGREADANFHWDKLEGSAVLLFAVGS
jgi:NitT/TauT family transport system substrate-binding protein|tara:strand:- start:514 stop:663 length:150 start_codon:yes stop_codon:yes gene_type:complete